jgi:hypothetical protein
MDGAFGKHQAKFAGSNGEHQGKTLTENFRKCSILSTVKGALDQGDAHH